MPYYTLTILELRNYAEWKSGFDNEQGVALRKASGMKSYQILQTEQGPNKIVVLCEWDNMDDARKFLQSEELQKANQQSGVIEINESYFLGEVEKTSV